MLGNELDLDQVPLDLALGEGALLLDDAELMADLLVLDLLDFGKGDLAFDVVAD